MKRTRRTPNWYSNPMALLATAALVGAIGGCAKQTKVDVQLQEQLPPTANCTEPVWIGLMEEGSAQCPAFEGWSASRLFESEREGPQELPTALAGFCAYERLDDSAPFPEAEGLSMSEVDDRDCLAVVPMQQGLVPSTAVAVDTATVRGYFQERAGRPLTTLAGEAPRLTLIDTLATTRPSDHHSEPTRDLCSASGHGYGLANMARELLCHTSPPGGCLADLNSQLALDHFYGKKDDATPCGETDFQDRWRQSDTGGVVGTIRGLARAIEAEVAAWRASSSPHLILNLSLGWEPRNGEDTMLAADLPKPALAVYRALEDAVCRGALVIAAAGNRLPGPGPHFDLTLPAAWEQKTPVCETPLDATWPLLYAVGGIRADGQPLANSRTAEVPRLVAYGDHAVAESHLPPATTDTLTGTSVASLVVSGAAAAVWYYEPGSSAGQVMRDLYEGGGAITDPAGQTRQTRPYCSGADCREHDVRRISVAHSAAAACRRAGRAGCPPDPGNPPVGPQPQIRLSDLFRSPPPAAIAVGGSALKRVDAPACGPGEVYLRSGSTEFPCPDRQVHGMLARSAVGPQPGSNPCPNCGTSSSHTTLWIQLDPAFWAHLESRDDLVLSSPRLRVEGGPIYELPAEILSPAWLAPAVQTFDLGGLDLEASDRLSLVMIVRKPGDDFDEARSLSVPLLTLRGDHSTP